MYQSYHKTICLDFGSEEFYWECMEKADQFKKHIQRTYQSHPELFPEEMAQGWCLNGYTPIPKKQDC